MARRLEQGSAVSVAGALRPRSFEDANGDTRRITEITATKGPFLALRAIEVPWANNDPTAVEDSEA